jgi:uncharacterized protein YqhQ
MAKFQYGGQALIEGVLMRGRNALAVAIRHPDGSIVWATERLDLGLRARRAMKLPFLRGLVLLYDTLVTGTRWLVRSATLQALALEEGDGQGGPGSPGEEGRAGQAGPPGPVATSILGSVVRSPLAWVLGVEQDASHEPDAGHQTEEGQSVHYSDPDALNPAPSGKKSDPSLGKGYGVAIGGMLILSFAIGIGIFFLLPLFLAQATVGRVSQGLTLQLSEGVIRVAIFIGYLLLVGRTPDVRRTFQYHGAEHMSIHTLEAGDPLTTEAARKYPTAHPRCGTEFLVVVLIVSIFAFALVGNMSPVWLVISRVILVPVIAAISYEILQFGARRRQYALVRALWSPGIWVQKITTRQPTDDMIEVAIVSLERALVADGNEIPAGSMDLASRPMYPEREATAAAAGAAEVGADASPAAQIGGRS